MAFSSSGIAQLRAPVIDAPSLGSYTGTPQAVAWSGLAVTPVLVVSVLRIGRRGGLQLMGSVHWPVHY